MWFDFGSSVTSSSSESLAGTVLAVDVYLACFVCVRISVRLFLTYLSGPYCTKRHLCHKGKSSSIFQRILHEKPAFTEDLGVGLCL